MNTAIGIVFVLLIILMIVVGVLGVRVVQQTEVMVIERLGKYSRTLTSGVNFIVPFIDRPRTITWRYAVTKDDKKLITTKEITRIDLRETVYDFPSQNVITADNVGIEIDALLYFQITDPPRAVYEIENLPNAIEKLTQTTLRNVVGGMELDQTLTSRDTINRELRQILDEATDKWGVKVNRVELQDIVPPGDIREAMEKQMRAERDKRASILEAEGKKQSAILEAEGQREAEVTAAEGEKQAEILRAEGEAAARIAKADAEGKAIERVVAAFGGSAEDTARYLVSIRYVDELSDIARSEEGDRLVFMPYEASGFISSLGSLRELYDGKS